MLVAELAERAWKLGTEPRAAVLRASAIAGTTRSPSRRKLKGWRRRQRLFLLSCLSAPAVCTNARCWRIGCKKNGFSSRPNAGAEVGPEAPTFLVATSAGEVGVDLDADHMVCDLVEWERMVQRLGRVNRLGRKVSLIEVIAAPLKDKKKDAENWESRFARLRAPLDALRGDASPGAIVALKERADPEFQARLKAASTSPPLRPALTRALIDTWSMTSLEQHTGRPDIQPWLRGWEEDEQPQTQVIWRKHLPVRSGVNAATFEEINAFFDAAPRAYERGVGDRDMANSRLARGTCCCYAQAQKTHPGARDSPVLFVLNSRNEPDRSDGREAQWTLGRIAKLKENKKQGDAFETSSPGSHHRRFRRTWRAQRCWHAGRGPGRRAAHDRY